MVNRFCHALMLVVLLTATTSMHWGVLQSIAWTTMLANNLRTGSLAEAVQKTFDGRHPCPLCRQIAAGKQSEKKTEFVTPQFRFEFVSEAARFVFAAPTAFTLSGDRAERVTSRSHAPPVPPPRPALV
ncbi:MAG TPA: hypothetical protein VL527_09820 [Dongiaceae bacterium]|nr:hypothetical protein [Dongiaceae bacterium]